ncbi:MAG: hypothetical protein FWD97_04445 [Defluviitaleaceae bacterium]|nr:hypothetical protein [Defluviitaleaceae bacterium]
MQEKGNAKCINICALELLQEYRIITLRKSLRETVSSSKPKALGAYERQINFTKELIEVLLNNKKLGKKLYWIIYLTYMTKRQPEGIEEILENISEKIGRIPRSSYFRLRKRALEILDNHLSELSADDAQSYQYA